MTFAKMLVRKTQRSVASSSNKRLRAEIESSSSSATSQSSYQEETEEESDDDVDDNLEPAWKIRDDDISSLLASYKNLSVSQHKQTIILSDNEKMSVNHVYFFDGNEDVRYSGVNPFPDIQSDLLEEFNLNDSFNAICQYESDMIGTVAFKLSTNKREEAEAIALKDMANSNSKICAKILYNLLQNYTRKADLENVDESLFITLAINPFIDVVFDYDGELTKSGFFTQLEGDYNIKPDVKYSAVIRQQKLAFLVFEVKCPNSVARDDFFKLTIELQIMLNRLITAGIDFPVVYGVLVYGYKCQVYKMDLKSPAIYRLIKIRSCYLPRNHDDFDVVKNSLATFTQLHTLVYREVDKAKKCTTKISSSLSWIRYPVI